MCDNCGYFRLLYQCDNTEYYDTEYYDNEGTLVRISDNNNKSRSINAGISEYGKILSMIMTSVCSWDH